MKKILFVLPILALMASCGNKTTAPEPTTEDVNAVDTTENVNAVDTTEFDTTFTNADTLVFD